MKKKYTIIEAIKEVLSSDSEFLSITEIYTKIIERSLYVFHAQDPLSVLRVELRRHSVGIDFPTASAKKYFVYDESTRRFRLLRDDKNQIKRGGKDQVSLRSVRELHHEYVDEIVSRCFELMNH